MKQLIQFCWHALSGAIYLVVITSIAVGLHYVIRWGEAMLGIFIVRTLQVCEYVLFTVDVILAMMQLFKAFKKHAIEIWKN